MANSPSLKLFLVLGVFQIGSGAHPAVVHVRVSVDVRVETSTTFERGLVFSHDRRVLVLGGEHDVRDRDGLGVVGVKKTSKQSDVSFPRFFQFRSIYPG